jgi:hypothetical protein
MSTERIEGTWSYSGPRVRELWRPSGHHCGCTCNTCTLAEYAAVMAEPLFLSEEVLDRLAPYALDAAPAQRQHANRDPICDAIVALSSFILTALTIGFVVVSLL